MDVSSFTYMGIPLASIATLCIVLLLVLFARYFRVGSLYYGAFFFAFLEFSRLIIDYPFGANQIVWVLRGVFTLSLLFLIPLVFSTYMSTSSGW